jgi:hypothetical protein
MQDFSEFCAECVQMGVKLSTTQLSILLPLAPRSCFFCRRRRFVIRMASTVGKCCGRTKIISSIVVQLNWMYSHVAERPLRKSSKAAEQHRWHEKVHTTILMSVLWFCYFPGYNCRLTCPFAYMWLETFLRPRSGAWKLNYVSLSHNVSSNAIHCFAKMFAQIGFHGTAAHTHFSVIANPVKSFQNSKTTMF